MPYYRISIAATLLMVAMLPVILWAVLNLPIGSADVHKWLPEGRTERARYEEFTRCFGTDQVILVSWDDASLEDARMHEFEEALKHDDRFDTTFLHCLTAREVIDQMQKAPLRMPKQAACDRLQGVLIGQNGTAALSLIVTPFGVEHSRQTVEYLYETADSIPGLSRNQLRLVGSVYEAYAVDQAAETSLKHFLLPSTFLGLAVCWWCVRSLQGMVVVMLLSGLGQLVMVSVVYYTGYRFSAVLIVLPTLVYMLTLSGAVHLMNYRSAARTSLLESAGTQAVKIGWKPCSLSSGTTVLGMGSLVTSQLMPVREFGVFAALGLVLATALLLLMFPFVSDLFFRTLPGQGANRGDSPGKDEQGLRKHSHAGRWIQQYTAWIQHHAIKILIVSGVLFAAAFLGILSLQSSTKVRDMFSESDPTHRNMKWFETEIGPIATVEVLLRYRKSESGDILDEILSVSDLCQRLSENHDVGGYLAATTFLPSIDQGSSVRATAQRAILRKRIRESTQNLSAQGVLFEDEEFRTWRIMSKVSATSDRSYGELTESVRDTVTASLQEITSLRNRSRPTDVSLTGLSPVMHETQITLLSDLGTSFLSAFLLITPVMMVIARSIGLGLCLMLPNVLPIMIAFGSMGLFGWPLDIAGILTASVALGIAVDDTTHFICWYSDELKNGTNPLKAVENTFASCTRAMIDTTLISCAAMLPFLFAGFLPTQQFAKLMMVMLTLALVADLVLLPAILLSPLGKWIALGKWSYARRVPSGAS
jgi:predicted RND superfamily exporter protein